MYQKCDLGHNVLRTQKRLCYTENMKLMILIGATIVGSIGGWLGASLDHGNFLGGWSILLSSIGSLIGIWVGYKAYQYL